MNDNIGTVDLQGRSEKAMQKLANELARVINHMAEHPRDEQTIAMMVLFVHYLEQVALHMTQIATTAVVNPASVIGRLTTTTPERGPAQ